MTQYEFKVTKICPKSGVKWVSSVDEFEKNLPSCVNTVRLLAWMADNGRTRLYRGFYWDADRIPMRIARDSTDGQQSLKLLEAGSTPAVSIELEDPTWVKVILNILFVILIVSGLIWLCIFMVFLYPFCYFLGKDCEDEVF